MAKAKTKAITLREAVDTYLAHLQAEGKAEPTVRSYKSDFEMLAAHFGEKTALGKITAPGMGKFLKSGPVTKMRSGKAKAERSIDKTRRAIRMFFSWCVEQRHISKSPFPGE